MTGSIRNKILVVFYLSSVLSLLGYILIYLLSQQQGELVEDSSQIPPVTEAWFRLNNGMQHAVSSQREWLLSGNSIFREGRMNAWYKEIEPALLELDRLYKTSRLWQDERQVEARTFYDIRLLIRNLNELQQQVEALTFRSLANTSNLTDRRDSDWLLANDMMVNQILPLQLNIEDAITTIVRWQSNFSRQNTLQIRNEVIDLNIRILFIALAVFLIGWILSRLLGEQIARSLQELRDAVRRVKDENFDGQIEISTQDEIGELAEEFREMLIAIQQRTQQLRNSFAELERAS
ncbi:MAG: HAMP domain-containing protein, partial [SAR324 cluster bacterium]|nr:HAMP domain-containing protein [SAR324 cluster bacterium]